MKSSAKLLYQAGWISEAMDRHLTHALSGRRNRTPSFTKRPFLAMAVLAILMAGCQSVPTMTQADIASQNAGLRAQGYPVILQAPGGELEGMRKIIQTFGPEYEAVTGCVVVSFVIGSDGRADFYQVLDSQPKGLFDQVMLRQLNETIFEVPDKPGRYATGEGFGFFNDRYGDPSDAMSAASSKCIKPPMYNELNPHAG